MTLHNDLCDYCGQYVDPIGNDGDALTRKVNGEQRLWCGFQHLYLWAEREKARQELRRDSGGAS